MLGQTKFRNRLYIKQSVGDYKAGEWYDNVSDDDADYLKSIGAGVDIEFAGVPCGCLLAEGKAVRLFLDGDGTPCPLHEAAALRRDKDVARAPKVKSLREQVGG